MQFVQPLPVMMSVMKSFVHSLVFWILRFIQWATNLQTSFKTKSGDHVLQLFTLPLACLQDLDHVVVSPLMLSFIFLINAVQEDGSFGAQSQFASSLKSHQVQF